jgi:hypothetical protein
VSDGMPHDYFTFTSELIPEGRRVFALIMACEMLDTGEEHPKVLETALAYEAFLKGPEPAPKPKAVK